MRSLITPADMRDMERRYFDATGTPTIDLMERAAKALCDCLIRRYGPNRRVYFACGPGGNGGDGYACARLYAEAGGQCVLFPAEPPVTDDARQNHASARAAGLPALAPNSEADIPDVWVDALYGTGLNRPPQGNAAALIERMNAERQLGSAIVSADIPSGLDGTTGAAFAPCVEADATIAFQFEKAGCSLADGLDMCGEITVADIGIPPAFYPDDMAGRIESGDVTDALPRRRRNGHKGHGGHLLVVAGSAGMAGAAVMCTLAALRSGTGLVTVACPESIMPILQTLAPCAMAVPLAESDGAISTGAVDALAEALRGKHAVAFGCGLSKRAAPEVVRLVLESGLPAVLDADALNLIAADEGLKGLLRPHHLITPHPGEAARLVGTLTGKPLDDAMALRTLGCQALLKGATTVIPVGTRAWLSASGCRGMAKGGSGDVLTGLTGSLMAQFAAAGTEMTGDALARCAAIASEIHGRAGEQAQALLGDRGMCATDIIDALPAAFMEYGE